ncbi:bifunctional diguanylate cyclase/phosphodiesterase [Deinococcus aquatilis]|uniref:bifunctional diguanylate cyclase/phosphodiesterase n=1 Tax=Deinococcus aquatilis TaxID=519440 RepID=UPI000376DED1|nr:EAL domain-containing protein [Deinococcus aquatilis]
MSEQPSSLRSLALSERLQSVTEALAGTRTPTEVFQIVLHPALQALSAVAGVVLLVNDMGAGLTVAATQGYAKGEQTLWQTGTLHDFAPTDDALRQRKALYFEHQDALTTAYPDLNAPLGWIAVVATAVIPMVLDDRALGVIMLVFTEPHHFPPEERRFLYTLAGQGAVALDRLQLATRLRQQAVESQTRAETLAAFVTLTEAVGTELDLSVLTLCAQKVMRTFLPELSVSFYVLEDKLWKAVVLSGDIAPQLAQLARAGLPVETPSFVTAVQACGPSFTEHWDTQAQAVAHTESYGAAAFYPYFRQGQPFSMFTAGTQQSRVWTPRDRAMFTAVGRSLGLALERANQTALLQLQNVELTARTQALEGFAELTRDLAVQHDPYALIRRAQDVMLSLLPPGNIVYYERDGAHWRNRVQVGALGNAGLQAFVDAGPRVGATPTLDLPWTTRQPLYQDRYAQGSDTPAELVEHLKAHASLPVVQRREPVGILAVALFEQRTWSRTDRVILETVIASLELALERLEAQTQAIRAQQDASQQRTQAEAMTYLAHHDVLTDLLNRVGLMVKLSEMISAGTPFALFYLDIDGFKLVNDTLGHEAGDTLLQQIAQVLSSALGDEPLVARIGGDEFAAVVGGITEDALCEAVALQVQTALDRPFTVTGRNVYVTASTGIARFPKDGQTSDDLLRNADLAMYDRKRQAKNGWRHYTPDLSEEARTRLMVAHGLRGALGKNEFQLYYQPEIDLESGDVVCLEALLRWFPDGGALVPPDRFIPEAEASGLIVPIGTWVLNTACTQLAVWRRNGFPQLRVAVNVSPVQFVRSDFADTVAAALQRANLEPDALELELTERGVLADLPSVRHQARALQALGVRLALDDFGAGESNLGRLLHLPFNVLKLDRELISTLGDGPRGRQVLRALRTFATSLRLDLVAEGVETSAQLETVRALGCDRAQGYLLGRPAAVWPPGDQPQQNTSEYPSS